jgi:hypothetical protein
MPYRKTRKNQKKQKQKTRYQKQKGGVGGILSLFQKKPKSPPPFESYKSAINRLFLFLYSKVNPSTPGYIPLEANQKLLTLEQKDFFRGLLSPYVSRNENSGKRVYRQEEFVHEVLGMDSLSKLNHEIVGVESVGKPVQDIILNRPAIGESFAGSLDRLLPVLLETEHIVNYRQNWEQNICRLDPSKDQNKPMHSLYENRCIFMYHNEAGLNLLLKELQMVYGDSFTIGPGFPFMLLEKQFLPQMNEKVFPYVRIASYRLLHTIFVKDAFEQDGVVEMQVDLGNTLAETKPELWNNLPLVQIRKRSELGGLSLYKDKYLIVDDSTSLPTDRYISISRISPTTRIYGFDPQTSILLRTKYSSLWSQWVEDPNYTFFMFLSPQEQKMIAKLQFIQYMKEFRKNPSTALQAYSINLGVKENQTMLFKDLNVDDVWAYEKILRKYI